MLRVGIVGLPNVGKSSLFNALTAAGVPSENFPFCTVDPNVGTVEVPDRRLDHLHELVGSKRKVPTFIHFVDIAGLVAGASQGEGLGNRFLSHIREVDAIAHVLRCFEDPNVTHVAGSVDPVRDRDIVETELVLADLESIERRRERLTKKARSGEKEAQRELALVERVHAVLADGRPARLVEVEPEERTLLKQLQLLTAKPVLYVLNVAEGDLPQGRNRWTEAVEAALGSDGLERTVPVSSRVESELADLDPADRAEFLEGLGIEERGLDRLVREAYALLDLLTFFTSGEQESRAWTVRRGAKAPEAAGQIHSDFERGFIRAETIHYDEFVGIGSMKKAREEGRIRSEGKEYLVQDGDIMLFRFNV